MTFLDFFLHTIHAAFAGLLLALPPQQVTSSGITDVNSATFATASSTFAAVTSHIADPTTKFSVNVWFKGSTTGNQIIVGNWNTTNRLVWYLGISNTGSKNTVILVTGSSSCTATHTTEGVATVTDGAWHNIGADYDNTGTPTVHIYIDNSTDKTDTTGVTSDLCALNTRFVAIGGYYATATPTSLLNAQVDWVSIYYQYILTGTERTALYNSGHPPSNMTSLSAYSNATAFWSIGEGADTTTNWVDIKNANNMTVSNISSFTANVP